MSLDTAIARFRLRQQELFRDTATVTRPAPSSFSSATGLVTPAAGTEIYDGPCLFQQATTQGTDIVVGEAEVRERRTQVKFPAETDVEPGDVIVFTASVYDPSLIGRSYRVDDVLWDGWQICRRVAVVEQEATS